GRRGIRGLQCPVQKPRRREYPHGSRGRAPLRSGAGSVMPTFPGTILVFDLGTSYFKATLFDTGGTLKALARVATPYTNARAPYSESSVPVFDAALFALAH